MTTILAGTSGYSYKPWIRRLSTASWGYLRLRRAGYGSTEVAEWAAWIDGEAWDEAFVFFKHEDAGVGPRLARELSEAASD